MQVAKLEQNIKGAFVWLGLLTVAMGVSLYHFDGTIDEGFETVNRDVATAAREISAQTATLESIDARLARSEDRLDQRNVDAQGSD